MTLRATTRSLPTTFFHPRGLRQAAAPSLHPTPSVAAARAPWHQQPLQCEQTIVLQQDVHEQATPDPSGGEGKAPDERTLRLGRTISILHERLPTLLASPLPAEILSPHIELDLFPSTHPHLPRVRGRLSYTAALWTAPVAWGRVPVLGNVRLVILSARMFNLGPSRALTYRHTHPSEKLVVRWKTCGRDAAEAQQPQHGILDFLSRSNRKAAAAAAAASTSLPEHQPSLNDSDESSEFTGLFIFEFDGDGRVSKHTIEHAQQGGNWEKMTRVVSVTDWLLGLAKRRREGEAEEQGLALGCANAHVNGVDASKPAAARRACRTSDHRRSPGD